MRAHRGLSPAVDERGVFSAGRWLDPSNYRGLHAGMVRRRRQLRTFFIKTYGCQMNELDSELLVGQLRRRGLTAVEDEADADLLLFNTCSIRDLAERKVMGKLGQLGKLYTQQGFGVHGASPGIQTDFVRPVIGVTGCMAMAKKDSLFRKLPHVDFILGTNNINDLSMVLDIVTSSEQRVIRTDDRFEDNLDYLGASRQDGVKAYVSIIRGCDKFCTYCVVPYTRGQEVSRPLEDVLSECRVLLERGYKEIMLLGQNVNSYGKDLGASLRFHDLLHALDGLPGAKRVRFMTSHPVDITEELMCAVRDLPSLCPFVHFPMQAGSNRILRKMNRLYTIEHYMEKVARLRELVPHVALGTDIIVGFPTETEEDFEQTYRYFEEVDYSVGFIFAYSQRQGTPAMRWRDDVPEAIKQERLQRLLELQERLALRHVQALVGSTVEVLVEKVQDSGALKGRTPCWKSVSFTGPASLLGTVQRVQVTGYVHQTLVGSVET